MPFPIHVMDVLSAIQNDAHSGQSTPSRVVEVANGRSSILIIDSSNASTIISFDTQMNMDNMVR